jgi:hypothetical protein
LAEEHFRDHSCSRDTTACPRSWSDDLASHKRGAWRKEYGQCSPAENGSTARTRVNKGGIRIKRCYVRNSDRGVTCESGATTLASG